MSPDVINGNANLAVADAPLWLFGIMQSTMHMAWVRAVCGRLKSDYRYSAGIVYNNFPWPELPAHQNPHTVIPANAGIQLSAPAANNSQELDSGVRRNDELCVTKAPSTVAPGKQRTAIAASDSRMAIQTAAQGVLDARLLFPDATLADLYDPLTMPPALVKAHQHLDKAVDAAYTAAEKAAGRKPPKLTTDAERVAFLFERYQALTSLLPVAKVKKARKPRESKED